MRRLTGRDGMDGCDETNGIGWIRLYVVDRWDVTNRWVGMYGWVGWNRLDGWVE
jgi:hypothetical protein